MSAPTPTPWRYQQEITSGFQERPYVRFELYRVDGPFGHPATCALKEDAELIVRAVNAHEALVAAVEHALRYMEARGTYDTREAAAPLRAALAQVKP